MAELLHRRPQDLLCIYLAKDEATVRRHSELAGFPADKNLELKPMIDPGTPDGGT